MQGGAPRSCLHSWLLAGTLCGQHLRASWDCSAKSLCPHSFQDLFPPWSVFAVALSAVHWWHCSQLKCWKAKLRRERWINEYTLRPLVGYKGSAFLLNSSKALLRRKRVGGGSWKAAGQALLQSPVPCCSRGSVAGHCMPLG